MTLRMQRQSEPFGSFTAIDLAAERFGNFKLTQSYRSPSSLTWIGRDPQFSRTDWLHKFIRVWDDELTDRNSVAFSAANPLFAGFIEEIQPTASNRIEFMALDPTHAATSRLTIMSGPWQQGNISGGNPPVEGFGTYPRAVFNVTVYSDEDFSFARTLNTAVDDMVGVILLDQYQPLYWMHAAPGDGSNAGNDTPFDLADAGFDFRPQEKVVFETEGVRAGIERLLEWEPERKLIWEPASKKWRFRDVTAAPTVTLTLNDFSGPHHILAAEIHRSLMGRYTAVKYYGPERVIQRSVQTGGLGLTTITPHKRWQITNPDHRRVARLLPEPQRFPGPEFPTGFGSFSQWWYNTRAAQLQVRYETSQAGTDRWQAVHGWNLDPDNGIIFFEQGTVFRWKVNADTENPTEADRERPVAVRFIYGSYDEPISARFPASGFSGTAFSVAGLESELRLYDEMLATGYLFGIPITTPERVEQFTKLAQKNHSMLKDVVYTGSVVLDGINPAFHNLNRRVNLAAVDGDGEPLTTGLESVGMFLTDAEYDFETQLTTITLSSDHLDVLGFDEAQEKERLKIRAMELRIRFNIRTEQIYRPSHRLSAGMNLTAFDTVVTVTPEVLFVDPTDFDPDRIR